MLREKFSNPFNPSLSLQLNNKFWPNSRFNLLNLLLDCENSINEKGINLNSSPLLKLKSILGSYYYARVMLRLGKILCFQSNFNIEMITIQGVDSFGIEKFNLFEPFCRKNIELLSSPIFNNFQSKLRKIYCSAYKFDFTRINKSIRYHYKKENFDINSLDYYHFDELKSITGIIYLTNVKKFNGAFSYINGSELIPRSNLLTAIHQTVAIDMGLTSVDSLASLPLEFRSSPNIGSFIEDEKIIQIKKHEVILEGPPGTAFMFNGQKLLHRGGHLISGSRATAFFAPEGILLHKARSFISNPNYFNINNL